MTAQRCTERQMLDALHARHAQTNPGNGPRWVCAEHVRNDAGFWALRTLDFMALDLWPSTGLPLHGFEVKCSRSDWLRELSNPAKAEAFRPYLDFMWLVVSDRTIVKPGELPDGWGLVAMGPSGKLRQVEHAPRREAEPLPRGMRASLARSIARTAARRAAAP